ncbi:hypothetical protein C8J56DRAFT_1100936 [Mycena floridula]|nr:hypothetical protein C8J56DRAFT_1100936 [Mycena floridula]
MLKFQNYYVRNPTVYLHPTGIEPDKLLDDFQILAPLQGSTPTESGQIYRVRFDSTEVAPRNPTRPSRYVQVTTFDQNAQNADIRNAFSPFGHIVAVTAEEENPAIGQIRYNAIFMVQFENIEDAVKADSTVVSLSNGGLLQTRMIIPRRQNSFNMLQFFVEHPWSKGYSPRRLFVEDLSYISNVPLNDLEYRANPKSGVTEIMVQTKNFEDAKKIMAFYRLSNTKFTLRYSHRSTLPEDRRASRFTSTTT